MAKNIKFYPDSFLDSTDSEVQLAPLAIVVQDQQNQYKEQAIKSIAAKRLSVLSAIQTRRDGAMLVMNSSLPQAYIGQKTNIASRANILGKNGVLTGGVADASKAIDWVDFSSESISRSGLTLSVPRYYHNTCGNSSLAYVMGGDTAGNTVEELNYSSKTLTTIAATLPFLHRRAANISQKLAGYFLGGNSPASSYISSILKLTFATKAISSVSENLATSRQFNAAVSSPTKAYVYGGSNASFPLTIEAFTYATETIANISAQLQNRRAYAYGAGNTKAGYLVGDQYGAGGYAETDTTNSYACTISKLTYSDESCVTLANLFSDRVYNAGTLNSGRAGYFLGGSTTYWGYWGTFWGVVAYNWQTGTHTRIQKLNYDNQSASVIGTVLISGNYGLKGTSDYAPAL